MPDANRDGPAAACVLPAGPLGEPGLPRLCSGRPPLVPGSRTMDCRHTEPPHLPALAALLPLTLGSPPESTVYHFLQEAGAAPMGVMALGSCSHRIPCQASWIGPPNPRTQPCWFLLCPTHTVHTHVHPAYSLPGHWALLHLADGLIMEEIEKAASPPPLPQPKCLPVASDAVP